jgi:hypothetical protein
MRIRFGLLAGEVDPVVKTERGVKIESHPPFFKESC